MIFPNALILKIPVDHVGYGVKDLHETLNFFGKLGFTATAEKELMVYDPETAESRPLGQLSAHIMFDKGYIELSAPTWNIEDNHLIPLVERYPGIHILALATASAEKQYQACQKQYENLTSIAQASRKIEYGNNQGTAQFNWFPLPDSAFPEGIVCFVEHLTRDLVFQQEVLSQANGACALAGVTLYSRNTRAMENKYNSLLRDKQPISHVHESSYLRLISDDDLAGNNHGLTIPNEEALIGLDIEVMSLKTLKDILHKNAIDFNEHTENELIVSIPTLTSFILFKERNR